MNTKESLIEQISRAIKFWYCTEDAEIERIASGRKMSSDELKAKYAKLKTKIKQHENH